MLAAKAIAGNRAGGASTWLRPPAFDRPSAQPHIHAVAGREWGGWESAGLEDLQVPTKRIPVELITASGEHLFGALFAAESPFPAGETAYVLQVLNDQRSFIPIGMEGTSGRNTICNKRDIVLVRLAVSGAGPEVPLDSPLDGTPPEGGDDTCALTLAGGGRIEGRLVLETRWSSSRLLDKLNQAEQFIPIVTGRGVEFVQRDHVLRAE